MVMNRPFNNRSRFKGENAGMGIERKEDKVEQHKIRDRIVERCREEDKIPDRDLSYWQIVAREIYQFEQDGIKQIRPARLEPKPDESRLLGWWRGFWKRVGIK